MSTKLNPSAKEWVPSWHPSTPEASNVEDFGNLPNDPFEFTNEEEYAVTQEQLDELEEVDNWVAMLAAFEEEEQECLIANALRYGDQRKVQQVAQLAMAHGHKKKSISAGSSPRSQ